MSSEKPFVSNNGQPISEELADKIASEVEVGYDLEELAKVRPGPGRKSLDGSSGRSPAIQLRLTPDTYQRVRDAAAEAGESISDFVRDAIDRNLRRLDRGSHR